jgi:hypothetical protein
MNASKKLSVGVIVACTALLGGAIFGGVADAKSKKIKTFNATKAVNLPIPDRVASQKSVALNSVINVPKKKYKGKTVGFSSLSVTYQLLGSSTGAADDINVRLISPGGRTIDLLNPGGTSVGPLTLSPDSATGFCPNTGPCDNADPFDTLPPPYIGTARDTGLAFYGGVPMKGNWTLQAYDQSVGKTTTLVQWQLHIKPNAT